MRPGGVALRLAPMHQPRFPWLERQSTNRDAVLLLVLAIPIPVALGVLDHESRQDDFDRRVDCHRCRLAGACDFLSARSSIGPSNAASRCRSICRARHRRDRNDAEGCLGNDSADRGPGVRAKGVFEPAHTILSQRGRGDVRFSVLEPVEDTFKMAHALGHSVESRRAFTLKIIGSFAGLTYADGVARYSNDTGNDDRFTPHPQARPGREYASIIAGPIRKGHEVVGVLVVVAQNPEAFTEADVAYIGQLGALIGLAQAVDGA